MVCIVEKVTLNVDFDFGMLKFDVGTVRINFEKVTSDENETIVWRWLFEFRWQLYEVTYAKFVAGEAKSNLNKADFNCVKMHCKVGT